MYVCTSVCTHTRVQAICNESCVYIRTCTVPMTGRKSRTLELLAFDEYCRFDTSACASAIKRGSIAQAKFTEIYGNPRGSPARALCSDFLPVIGTVLNLVAGLLARARSATALLYHWEIKLIYQ